MPKINFSKTPTLPHIYTVKRIISPKPTTIPKHTLILLQHYSSDNSKKNRIKNKTLKSLLSAKVTT